MTAARMKLVRGFYWVALFAVMHTPKSRLPTIPVSHLDKLAHFVGYGILATLCALSAARSGTALTRSWYAKWLLILAAYAIVDEALQPLVNRSADVLDWAADVLGVLVAFGIAGLLTKRS